LDIKSYWFKYSKIRHLAGAGTQTAALAFGGYWYSLLQVQQKNIMDQLGQVQEFYEYGKKMI
jgi:hypothetical protein